MIVMKPKLIEKFGDYPQVRVIGFLIENDVFDYSKTEIAELSEVSFNTLKTFWSKLENSGFVKKTRRIGKSQLYQLNKENEFAKILIEMDKKIILKSIKLEEPEIRKKMPVKLNV